MCCVLFCRVICDGVVCCLLLNVCSFSCRCVSFIVYFCVGFWFLFVDCCWLFAVCCMFVRCLFFLLLCVDWCFLFDVSW